MKAHRRFPVVFLIGFVGATAAGGQELTREAIPNWPAPATWSPARAHGALTTMGEITNPFPFIGLSPCRILDTRGNGAPIQGGIFTGGSDVRSYVLAGKCSIPTSARAVSLNFTVTGPGQTTAGFLTAWPTGGAVPNVSILNWDRPQQQIANAAVVPTSSSVSITVNVSAPTHVLMDVNGYYAGAGTGSFNTFLGLDSGNFTMTGDFNTGIGNETLTSNTTGGDNTALGRDTLFFNTAGSNNTALGDGALLRSQGDHNTGVGRAALTNQTSGDGNIALGSAAGGNLTGGGYNIDIGNGGVIGDTGTIRIGTTLTHTRAFIAGVSGVILGSGSPVFIDSNGQLGTGVPTSSRRFKEDIQDIAGESDGLMKLRPVAFRYKHELDPDGLPQYGLIAEEVVEVYPDLVVCDREGRPESVRYPMVNALLLNEVQKQHRAAEAQERTIERQNESIEKLRARLARLEALVSAGSRP